MNRRKFIETTSLAAFGLAIVPRTVLGGPGYIAPSDKINLGYIGVGKQSYWLLDAINKCPEINTLAACDVDKKKLAAFIQAVPNMQQRFQKTSTSVQGYGNFEEMLSRKDIDAVVIATPDHWHAQIAIDAAKAGKDIYCEKPLALTIGEGRAMVNATRKYNRVFQTGSMQRSSFNFRQAAELVLNGYIGQVKEINVSIGDPVRECDLPSLATPEYLDWDMWVGPSPYRGYNPILCPPIEDSSWALWREHKNFGGGYVTDWGAHMFDIVQWALGMDNSGPELFVPPKEANAKRGLSFYYKNGVKVNHVNWGESNAIQFIGEKGKIEVSREFLRSNPENISKLSLSKTDKRLYFSDNHYQDWVDAIKKRTKPICDVEIGHRTSSLCNAVNIAYELQKDLKWDPKREKFDNFNANLMIDRAYRGKWDYRKY